MWDKKNSESVVVLLQRSQLSLYRSSNGKIVTLPFDATIVQDLEVVNDDAFCKYITAFLQQEKLLKASVIVLLDSSIYFSQKAGIADPDLEIKAKLVDAEKNKLESREDKTEKVSLTSELENNRKIFSQSVPFASVFTTIVTIGKEKFFIALNRDFYEPVIKILSERDLHVISILPIAVVSPLFGNGGFSPEGAATLINSIDKYKAHDFLENSLKADAPIVSTAMPTDPSDKKRLVLMGVLFIVLIGVLIWVILWSRQRDQILVPTPVIAPPVAQPTSTPVATPVATSASSLTELLNSTDSATADTRVLSVEVINASNDSQAGALLVERLKAVGFELVTATDAPSITGPMLVVFNSTVSIERQTALEVQLSEWGYQVRFEEDPDQVASITITLTDQ